MILAWQLCFSLFLCGSKVLDTGGVNHYSEGNRIASRQFSMEAEKNLHASVPAALLAQAQEAAQDDHITWTNSFERPWNSGYRHAAGRNYTATGRPRCVASESRKKMCLALLKSGAESALCKSDNRCSASQQIPTYISPPINLEACRAGLSIWPQAGNSGSIFQMSSRKWRCPSRTAAWTISWHSGCQSRSFSRNIVGKVVVCVTSGKIL